MTRAVQVLIVLGLIAVAYLGWLQIRAIWEPAPQVPPLVSPRDASA